MKIEILCIGNTPRPHEVRWIDDYLERAGKFATVRFHRIKDRDIETKISKQTHRIVLDEKGKLHTTEELKNLFARIERTGKKSVTFILGGAYGLPKETIASADTLFSLTPLTLPHRLALLVLCEQVYRVLSWRAGAPYHHE